MNPVKQIFRISSERVLLNADNADNATHDAALLKALKQWLGKERLFIDAGVIYKVRDPQSAPYWSDILRKHSSP